jgi:hypothetical protein
MNTPQTPGFKHLSLTLGVRRLGAASIGWNKSFNSQIVTYSPPSPQHLFCRSYKVMFHPLWQQKN